jgi:hypothetical protein
LETEATRTGSSGVTGRGRYRRLALAVEGDADAGDGIWDDGFGSGLRQGREEQCREQHHASMTSAFPFRK